MGRDVVEAQPNAEEHAQAESVAQTAPGSQADVDAVTRESPLVASRHAVRAALKPDEEGLRLVDGDGDCPALQLELL